MGTLTVLELKYMILQHLGETVLEGSGYPGGDPLAGATTTSEHLMFGICAALDALCVRVWKKSSVDIEDGDTEITAPDDLISVEGVYDNTINSFIPKAQFISGVALSAGNNSVWLDYPYGSIVFTTAMETGGKLYYGAYWEHPIEDSDVIECPNICSTYLSLYAASYCLQGIATQQANLRQYNTKVDSGNPIQLPAKDMSTFFLKRAEIELSSLIATDKGVA